MWPIGPHKSGLFSHFTVDEYRDDIFVAYLATLFSSVYLHTFYCIATVTSFDMKVKLDNCLSDMRVNLWLNTRCPYCLTTAEVGRLCFQQSQSDVELIYAPLKEITLAFL